MAGAAVCGRARRCGRDVQRHGGVHRGACLCASGYHLRLYDDGDLRRNAVGTKRQRLDAERADAGASGREAKDGGAMSEPSGGSDLAKIKTRAVPDGDDWVLSGQKVYITNAHVADRLVVAAKTDPDAGRHGMSLLLVDTKADGVEIRPMDPLGRRTSLPNEVFFDEVRVSEREVIGQVGEGWKLLMPGLNLERLLLAAAGANPVLEDRRAGPRLGGRARSLWAEDHRISGDQSQVCGNADDDRDGASS